MYKESDLACLELLLVNRLCGGTRFSPPRAAKSGGDSRAQQVVFSKMSGHSFVSS